MTDGRPEPSKESEMIAEAIGRLRGENAFATTDFGPAPEGYVTIIPGATRLYPVMVDYFPDEGHADGEAISNALFEELLPEMTFGVHRDDVPQAVLNEQRRLSNDIADGDTDE